MLKLKEVVDRQRDELRAKVQEIGTISKEVEAVRRRLIHLFPLTLQVKRFTNPWYLFHMSLCERTQKQEVWNVEAP